MKISMKRLAAALLAVCISISAAGCGSSEESGKKSDQQELQEAYDGLSDKDKQDLDELKKEIEKEETKPTETTTTAAATTTSAETTTTAAPEPEDLGIKDPKYYTYLEDLAKNYAENESKNGAGTHFKGKPLYCDGKIYIPDGVGRTLYSYDIEKKELKTEFQSPVTDSKAFIPFVKYDSWFVKNGEIYLADNDKYNVAKVGKDGKPNEFTIPDGLIASTVSAVFDNGKILLTSNGTGEYEIFDPKSNTNKPLPVISVPSDHAGVNKDIEDLIYLFSDGNSFFFTERGSDGRSQDGVIYEYNTDTDETSIFFTDPSLTHEHIECRKYGDYLISQYDHSGKFIDGLTITRISDGKVILNDVPKPQLEDYRGGECFNFRGYKGSDRDTRYWFKLKYPDSSYDGFVGDFDNGPSFEEAEQLAAENGSDSNVFPITDKYYVYEDDAGYFLRTYEKGESDEELIITKKQIEEDVYNGLPDE